MRDEVRLFKRCIQPQIEPSIQQFSLSILQLKNKALMIVLESKPTFLRAIKWCLRGTFRTTMKNR